MREYIEQAIGLGMVEFGVSDHAPAFWLPGDDANPGTQMPKSELPRYLEEAQQLQAAFAGQISVKVGIEADYIDLREYELFPFLEGYNFDYVLGSVHYARGVNVFDRSRWQTDDPEDTYTDYYRQVILAAQTGLFDILSHLTVVEAYGPPIGEIANKLYPSVADAVAKSGCVVEINTSGYRKMEGDEPFPNRKMLRLLIERGVPLTFGSDSHQPEIVGYARDRVLALLHELGVAVERGPISIKTRRGSVLAYATNGYTK
jgi:histidinol-phosphatase (PHP family)